MTTIAQASGSVDSSLPIFVIALAGLSLLPFLLTMLTSFAKLVIVGGLVRQAVGTPQIPPTMVVTGIALILTLHIMAPVAIRAYEGLGDNQSRELARVFELGRASKLGQQRLQAAAEQTGVSVSTTNAEEQRQLWAAVVSLRREAVSKGGSDSADDGMPSDALVSIRSIASAVETPLRAFLTRHADRRHIALFENLQNRLRKSDGQAAVDWTSLRSDWRHDLLIKAPAFVLTELSEAFLIGFLIFVPFLIIDLVVSNVLLALGMQMLTPTMVSLPLKLLLFVLMDGWSLILQGIVLGYT